MRPCKAYSPFHQVLPQQSLSRRAASTIPPSFPCFLPSPVSVCTGGVCVLSCTEDAFLPASLTCLALQLEDQYAQNVSLQQVRVHADLHEHCYESECVHDIWRTHWAAGEWTACACMVALPNPPRGMLRSHHLLGLAVQRFPYMQGATGAGAAFGSSLCCWLIELWLAATVKHISVLAACLCRPSLCRVADFAVPPATPFTKGIVGAKQPSGQHANSDISAPGTLPRLASRSGQNDLAATLGGDSGAKHDGRRRMAVAA